MIELVVFAREPRPGSVKTRLAREVGAAGAARAYALMLEATLDVAVASGLQTRLSLAEPPLDTVQWKVPWEVQVHGGLGDRLAAATDRAFERGVDGVVIIGSDCPELSGATLHGAASGLARASVVIGPARDGGYWAIGTRDRSLDLFAGIPWSSAQTYAQTVARLEDLGVEWVELEWLQDLDTLSDLDELTARGRTPAPLLQALWRAVGVERS